MVATAWLEVAGLSARRRGSHFRLGPVDLSLGEETAGLGVMGLNGSGKTTLLLALLGQLPFRGEVRWFGRTLGSYRPVELARTVALFPQLSHHLPPFSVAEFVRLGTYPFGGGGWLMNGDAWQRVERALARVGALELWDRPVSELSGGELQRVKLARTLAQEPRVILLDEPNAFLDLRAKWELARLLGELSGEGIRLVVASHDPEFIQHTCQRLLLLDRGRVAALGEVEEVCRSAKFEQIFTPSRAVVPEGGGQGRREP